jgi:hypothetical protein
MAISVHDLRAGTLVEAPADPPPVEVSARGAGGGSLRMRVAAAVALFVSAIEIGRAVEAASPGAGGDLGRAWLASAPDRD